MVKNSKTLKLVVCMSLIVALAISALSLSVRATYENTHNNTGNQASDIVGIAATQVGYGEGGDGWYRINLALPRAVLEKALRCALDALKENGLV